MAAAGLGISVDGLRIAEAVVQIFNEPQSSLKPRFASVHTPSQAI